MEKEDILKKTSLKTSLNEKDVEAEKKKQDENNLSAFLSEIPEINVHKGAPLKEGQSPVSKEELIAALREVNDPEIMINVYDLGLIYKTEITKEGDAEVEMTLTSPLCPMAEEMPEIVAERVSMIDGIGKVHIKLVWDPPWTIEMLSDEVKLLLNLD